MGESLWGRRGIVKAVSAWAPMALFVAAVMPGDGPRAAAACFQALAAVACWVLVSILANDLADRSADVAAGKQRWIQRLPAGVGAAIVAALAVGGAVPLALSGACGGAGAAYAGALAAALLYSVRPFRLKGRGVAGLLAYSGAGCLAYAVLPWALLRPGWRALAAVGPAVLLDKWVNLHFHQVVDYAADRPGPDRTYAVRVGRERALGTLRWAARLASLSMLLVLAWLAWGQSGWGLAAPAAGAGAAAAAGLYARFARRRGARASALVGALPWPYLGLTWAVFHVLPPVLFARLALDEAALWGPAGAAALWAAVSSWHAARYRYE